MRLLLMWFLVLFLAACTPSDQSDVVDAGRNRGGEDTSPEDVITHSICGSDDACAGHIERVHLYWTPERMRDAIPVPLPVVDVARAGPAPSDVSIDPSWRHAPREPHLISSSPNKTFAKALKGAETETASKFRTKRVSGKERKRLPYSATGKVWFTNNGVDNVCSAAVVDDKLLVTASHCVYETSTKTWATNFYFCAAYNYTIFGGCQLTHKLKKVAYTGRKAYLNRGFVESANYNYDAALIACDGGDDIIDYTGHLGIDSASVSAFNGIGYPAVKDKHYDFDGGHMWLSVGNQSACDVGSGRVGMWNNLTGGASGGPWTIKDPKRSNYLNGVNSTWCAKEFDDQTVSPLLRKGFWNLWAAAH